jgi:HK97 family phage major capsid protein/HK97 family phage prohead protease
MPETLIYKAGQQIPSRPFEFIMSSAAKDAYGDIVEQDWDLTHFRANPIALWAHSTKDPIGTWEDVRVVAGRLQGRLKLAAPGTSPTVDMVRGLLEQDILKAVSVGFTSESAEPLDSKDSRGGFKLSKNKLHECSVVSIGANEDALRKYLRSADPALQRAMMLQSSVSPCVSGACVQLERAKSRASDIDPTTTFIPASTRKSIMSLADKIQAKQQEILAIKDQIAAITNDIDATGALTDPQTEALGELSVKLERATGHLHTMEQTEAVLAKAVGSTPQPTVPAASGAPRIEVRSNKPKGHRAFATIASIVKGFGLRQDPAQIARDGYKDQAEIEMLVRAATAPATTVGATWAANLVEETWGEMVELLRDVSVYARAPGMRVDFANTLNLPVQNGRGALAAGFVAENGAIPVKEGSIGTTSLIPKKLAVISAYTKDLARRSVPSIQQIVQTQILSDTAEGLDTLFLDATARSATRPAGLRDTTETGSGNIAAVTNVATGAHGCTVKEILTDVDALLGRVEAIKGSGGAWLMNPAQVRGLRNKQDATTGQFVFRDSIDSGRFEGIPILSSTNVTAGIVAYIADGAMGYGSELMPYFESSDQATLHFEGASPLAIGTVASPTTVAAPTLSLFQQDLVAIKSVWTLDWRVLRIAGVQILTAATGW